jgi:hypothetical protein
MIGRTEFMPDPDKDWCLYVAEVDSKGETDQVETDQFYTQYNALTLSCTESLPAELMAKALHAAWLVLEEECQKRFA